MYERSNTKEISTFTETTGRPDALENASNLMFYDADAREIRYTGRHVTYSSSQEHSPAVVEEDGVEIEEEQNEEGEVAAVTQFAYSGVSVQCCFVGTAVYARMNGGGNYFNVIVDGALHNVIHTSEALETYLIVRLPTDPEAGPAREHTLCLEKRTEAVVKSALDWFSVVNFYGLFVCGQLLSAEKMRRKPHVIEFVGDSDVCGFGCDGPHTAPNDIWNIDPGFQNAGNSFASIIGRAFGAETHLTSWSGVGVVAGPPTLGTDATVVGAGMRACYGRVLPNEDNSPTPAMTNTRQPDLVCVYIGGCDVSDTNFDPETGPSAVTFMDYYAELLHMIRSARPKAPILCLVPDATTTSAEGTREGQARTSIRLQECVSAAIMRARDQHDIQNIHYAIVIADLSDPKLRTNPSPDKAPERQNVDLQGTDPTNSADQSIDQSINR